MRANASYVAVMAGLDPAIHVFDFNNWQKQGVDHRGIGERSDAVLRTALPGDDDRVFVQIQSTCETIDPERIAATPPGHAARS
jgi:hypothetical protein